MPFLLTRPPCPSFFFFVFFSVKNRQLNVPILARVSLGREIDTVRGFHHVAVDVVEKPRADANVHVAVEELLEVEAEVRANSLLRVVHEVLEVVLGHEPESKMKVESATTLELHAREMLDDAARQSDEDVREGEAVEFEITEGPKGLQASNVTKKNG